MKRASIGWAVPLIFAAGCGSAVEVSQTSLESLPADTLVGSLRVAVVYDDFRQSDPLNAHVVSTREKDWAAHVRKGFAVRAGRLKLIGAPDTALPVLIEITDVDLSDLDRKIVPGARAHTATVRAKVTITSHGHFTVGGSWAVKPGGGGFEEFAYELGAGIASEIDRLRAE